MAAKKRSSGKKKKKGSALVFTSEVILGRHPTTNIIHRLTLEPNGNVLIERGSYMHVQFSRYDGSSLLEWREFEPLTSTQDLQMWLIDTIRKNRSNRKLLRMRRNWKGFTWSRKTRARRIERMSKKRPAEVVKI